MRIPVSGKTVPRSRLVGNVLTVPLEHTALLSNPCWEI